MRALRKAKNKTRLLPSKDAPPAKKRKIEDGAISAPEKDWEKYEKLDWDKEIEIHRKNIEKREEERNLQEKLKENNEPSWELLRYCTEYLEENSEYWAKRKRINEQEQSRQERLARARKQQMQTRITIIEKKIQEGIELLPREKREQLEREDMKRRNLKLQETKSSLWKLRKKEEKTDKKTEIQDKLEKLTIRCNQ